MTRKEEIIEAGIEYTMSRHPMCIGGDAFSEQMKEFNRSRSFEDGAKWADSHPVFYKGQTRKMMDSEVEFTDDWFKNHKEQPTYADAIEWMKEKMIEKLRTWMVLNMTDTNYFGIHGNIAKPDFIQKIIAAMEK